MNRVFWWCVALAVVVGLIVMTIYLGVEGTAYLVFGWIVFLWNTIPRIQVDWPSALLGGVALLLFIGGLHALARGLLRPYGVAWKARWSLTCTVLVVLTFAAGISVIGLVHQVGWLATSREPTMVQTANPRGNSRNQLKFIGLAINERRADDGFLPAGKFANDGRMLHSWETEILPYLAVHIDYDRNKPWNDPVNQDAFKHTCPVFLNPDIRGAPYKDAEGYGLSHYAANSRVMAGNYAASLKDMEGHASTTILIGEVNANFKPWGHPANWRDPAKGINRSPDGFGGRPRAGGANFLMADGSVKFISERTSLDVLRALASPKREDKGDLAALEAVLETAR